MYVAGQRTLHPYSLSSCSTPHVQYALLECPSHGIKCTLDNGDWPKVIMAVIGVHTHSWNLARSPDASYGEG